MGLIRLEEQVQIKWDLKKNDTGDCKDYRLINKKFSDRLTPFFSQGFWNFEWKVQFSLDDLSSSWCILIVSDIKASLKFLTSTNKYPKGV